MKRVPSLTFPVIAIDRRSRKPLYRQLYDGFRNAILERRLRAGERIPSTRSLAAELRISRFPLLNAFDQLAAEGYLETGVGAGTFVARSLPVRLESADRTKLRNFAPQGRKRPVSRDNDFLVRTQPLPWLRGWGAFRVHQPATDQFPHDVWSRVVGRNVRRAKVTAGSMDYGDPLGYRPFREAVATYLRSARAVRCEADQVMVTSGSQQALNLAARVLLDPSSPVWIEEPGYVGARDVLQLREARIIPVPVDEEGLNVTAGIKRFPKARAVYITPSHQYPLGATMSAPRRLQLLDWAERSSAWIIEDDYDSEYRYESLPIASLQGLDRNSRVLYIGTFSKVLFPSLRVGYMVIPADLVERFAAVRDATDIFPQTFVQMALAEFIREGHFARHLRRMRALYAARRAALVNAIDEELGDTLTVHGSEAGMHLVATLIHARKDVTVSTRAGQQGLWVMPLSRCYWGTPSRQGFVIGFGGTDLPEILDGVRRLKTVLGR